MRLWPAALAGVLLVGCGGGAKGPSAREDAEPPPVVRDVVVEAAEVTRRDDKQRVVWTARSAGATLRSQDDKAFGGEFDQVSGRLFTEGKAVSEFAADRGLAERESERLRLSGRVRVTSTKPPATLTAREVLWRPERGLIEALGDVRIQTPEYDAGPFERLWATPDLRRFGTPDTFPNAARPSERQDGPN